MPLNTRVKTKYPGVYYVTGHAVSTGKPEKIYYIRYRKDGKEIEEKAGRQFQDDMTPARAAQCRTRRIEGELSNKEKREALEAEKRIKENTWTIGRLWSLYETTLTNDKSRKVDEGRYNKYIKDRFGSKEPHEIILLDVDRLRLKLSRKLSPQSVKHVLTLLSRIINFGTKRNLCKPLSFHIKKPQVNNIRTEDLSPEQLRRLMESIESDSNPHARGMMKMALYTGMRRGEMFKLKWSDIDFERGFISIKDPKGGVDQKVPLNEATRNLLEAHPKGKSPFVFPGRDGGQRVRIQHAVNRIRKNAKLPKEFRPLHGLRHVYASMLASSGQVDMYTLQKLLTHKSPLMTQRYAHLRDEALKKAADLAGDLINDISSGRTEKVNITTIGEKGPQKNAYTRA